MQAAEERRKRLKLMRESGVAQEDAEPAATPLSGGLKNPLAQELKPLKGLSGAFNYYSDPLGALKSRPLRPLRPPGGRGQGGELGALPERLPPPSWHQLPPQPPPPGARPLHPVGGMARGAWVPGPKPPPLQPGMGAQLPPPSTTPPCGPPPQLRPPGGPPRPFQLRPPSSQQQQHSFPPSHGAADGGQLPTSFGGPRPGGAGRRSGRGALHDGSSIDGGRGRGRNTGGYRDPVGPAVIPCSPSMLEDPWRSLAGAQAA